MVQVIRCYLKWVLILVKDQENNKKEYKNQFKQYLKLNLQQKIHNSNNNKKKIHHKKKNNSKILLNNKYFNIGQRIKI